MADDNNFDVTFPASGMISVTPSDSINLTTEARAIYVGGAGNLAVIMKDGTTGTFTNVPAGYPLPIRATRILATGTTATGIIALY
jgi:hypothetical protein